MGVYDVTLGQKIRVARLEQKLTQEQLAGSDLTKSYISELERGRRNPRLITLKALARRLNRPLSYFQDGIPEDREAEAFLHLGMARVQAEMGKSARPSLERAQDLAAQQGDEILQARIELALAMVDQQLGHFPRAQRRLDRCLRVLGHAGDIPSLVAAHECLGQTKLRSGDAASALWAFRAAIQLAGQLPHDPIAEVKLNLELGVAHKVLGDSRAARDAFLQGLDAAATFRDQGGVATWHLGLADSSAAEGRFEQAFEHAGVAQAVYETLAYRRRLSEIHQHLGEIAREEGNFDEAEHHYYCCIGLNDGPANVCGAAHTLSSIALVLLERGCPDLALTMCEAALNLLTGETDRGARARTLMILGSIHHRQGRRSQAKAAFQEGLTLSMELKREEDIRLARQELALLAIEAADLAEARQYLEGLREMPRIR